MSSIEDIKLDIEELEKLLKVAERIKVKNLLDMEIHKLQSALTQLTEEQNNGKSSDTPKPVSIKKAVSRPCHTITDYGWDQSDKFMKIYVTVKGVQNIPTDNIKTKFTNRSVQMWVTDLEGKDYTFHISNLNKTIDVPQCKHKVKQDTVLLMMRKEEESKTWPYVTAKEEKQKKLPKPDDSKDPNDSLMEMLKNMYDEGDDEMKRTLGKAMYESRMKQGMGM